MKNSELHSPPGITLRRVAGGESDNKTVTRFKNARRRRLRIRRMKYTCEAKVTVGNGGAPAATEVVESENNRREIHKSMEILMSLSSAEENRSSSSERNGAVLSYGSVSMIGKRKEMEDAVSVEIGFAAKENNNNNSKCDFFAVFDGHGGAQVAEMCRDRMHRLVAEELDSRRRRNDEVVESDWVGVMEGCFGKMDGEVGENAAVRTVGSTAVVAVVGSEEVVVANCGDCRAVLGRGGEAIDLSSDHKPQRPDELMRIEEAGGRVINWNGHRVLGVLATSRSIGDQYLRPYVISKPEVTVTNRSSKDEFLILASDGLWDVISSEAACQVVRKSLNGQIIKRVSNSVGSHQSSGAAAAAALLTEIAMAKGSRDDISVIVVDLRV